MWGNLDATMMDVVLSNSEFGKALEHNDLGLPEPRPLSGSTNPMPFLIVRDAAFPV